MELGDADTLRKIQITSSALQSWGNEAFCGLSSQIADCKNSVRNLNAQPKTDSFLGAIANQELILDKLLKQDEIMWAQRSRANRLQYGDINTGFFS